MKYFAVFLPMKDEEKSREQRPAHLEFYTTKTGGAHSLLMPPMENVLYVLYSHHAELFNGLVSSLELIFWGLGIALVSAVIFGILVGWFARPREAIMPIVGIISPIPALAYTTYVVGCMPSFKS